MKRIAAGVLCMVITVMAAMPAMAAAEKNYRIEDAGWKTDGGRVEAVWEKTESPTQYRITVYMQTGSGGMKKVYSEKTGNHSLYVSPIIAFLGTGRYFFDVYPIKGGEAYKVSSDDMEVDSVYLNTIEAQVRSDYKEAENAPQAPVYVWNKGPSGIWQLRKNGSLVTDQWAQVGGFWYLLDASGNMLKGWQQKNGKQYYLNENSGVGGYPEGACMVNTVTPDGHRVDAGGALIR